MIVYCCPESAKVRDKMMASTAFPSVAQFVDEVLERKMKRAEITSIVEFDDLFQTVEIEPPKSFRRPKPARLLK